MRSQLRSWLALALVPAFGMSCGDDTGGTMPPDSRMIDARIIDAPMPDAPDPVTFEWDEGGEVRIEYQEIFTAAGTNFQARSTAFFWKDKTPKRYQFPLIPGCTMMGADDRFPLGMGTSHTYQDVGEVTIIGGASPYSIPYKAPVAPATTWMDGLARPHDTNVAHFAAVAGGGPTYYGNFNSHYDVVFGGKDAFPAQYHQDAIYLSGAWSLNTPAFGPVQLTAGQDFVITYNPPTETSNRPPGSALNFVAAIVIPGQGPVVDCISDNLNGTITIPAAMVDYALGFGTSGLMARAVLSHQVREFTDEVTHNHKRMDLIGIWCFVVPWTKTP